MAGVENDRPLSVSPYPVAWRVEVVNDDIHRGFEYVRYMTSPVPQNGSLTMTRRVSFYWGTTNKIWDVAGDKNPNSKVRCRLMPRDYC